MNLSPSVGRLPQVPWIPADRAITERHLDLLHQHLVIKDRWVRNRPISVFLHHENRQCGKHGEYGAIGNPDDLVISPLDALALV